MEKMALSKFKIFCFSAVILFFVAALWWVLEREPSRAFGGAFAPPMQQQGGGRYQISGCDANSAWIIDTNSGDVYLIYSNGKWKEVGSVLDEKKRMKK